MQLTIIDVRSRAEFQGGHVAESMNIPLQEIERRIEEIKGLNQPIILCCASGNRSELAEKLLKKTGIKCSNGGSWLEVNKRINTNYL